MGEGGVVGCEKLGLVGDWGVVVLGKVRDDIVVVLEVWVEMWEERIGGVLSVGEEEDKVEVGREVEGKGDGNVEV